MQTNVLMGNGMVLLRKQPWWHGIERERWRQPASPKLVAGWGQWMHINNLFITTQTSGLHWISPSRRDNRSCLIILQTRKYAADKSMEHKCESGKTTGILNKNKVVTWNIESFCEVQAVERNLTLTQATDIRRDNTVESKSSLLGKVHTSSLQKEKVRYGGNQNSN